MVYRGPSQGCQACRKRRIKCDGRRPACKNCVRREEHCSGYQNGFDALLKDQTASVPVKIQQRANAQERRRVTKENNQFLGMVQSMSPNPEVEALYFFFSNYVTVPRDRQTTRGFIELLLPLYSEARPDAPLSLATSAVALTLMPMWSQKGADAGPARRAYSRAVTSTKLSLNNRSESKADGLLAAVLMLDFYETLSGRWKKQMLSRSHQDGALALVEHRSSTNFDSEISKRLLIAVRNRLVFQGLRRKAQIEPDGQIWEDGSSMPHNPGITLDLLSMKVANLQTTAAQIPCLNQSHSFSIRSPGMKSSSMIFDVAAVMKVLQEATSFDAQLQKWLHTIPSHWHPVSISVKDIQPSIRAAGVYESRCEVYPHIHVSSILNSYRWTRILGLQLISRCDGVLGRRSPPVRSSRQESIMEEIQALVDGICASMPFLLGNRMTLASLGDLLDIEYPPLHPQFGSYEPMISSGDSPGLTATMSRSDHVRIAASMGGYFALNALLPILELARPPDGMGSTQLRMRPGQFEWMLSQVKRVQNLYRIIQPPLAS